jgi:hypothetical protein
MAASRGDLAHMKQAHGANISPGRLHTWPERCLGPADRLDYAIRRLVTPVAPEVSPVAATRRVSRSTRAEKLSATALLTNIQVPIGRYLFAEYDLEQPIPERLTHLLIQLEQPDGRSEAVT